MSETKYDNGDVFVGTVTAGKRSGQGTYKFADGKTQWVGNWQNDLMTGIGKYTGEDGTYEGDFEDSEKSGRGEFKWSTGDRFIGDWYKDTMNGEGQYFWPDGKVYEGCFRDGQRNGLGVLKMPDGSRYEGEFRNDKCEGYGRFTDANGGTYEGEWKDNKKHGKGVYTYPDGRKFDGNFVLDRKTTGFIINPDGSRIKVTFNPDGSIQSQELVQDPPKEEAKPKGPPPTNVQYVGVGQGGSDADQASRQAGVASWLSLDQRGREEHKASALAMSFGGDPSVYVRGGRSGVHYFRDRFKAQDASFTASGSAPTTIPYEDLRLPSKWNRPDIDPLTREIYLSDQEFREVFKMDKPTFANLPPWKKNQIKQMVKLY